jgi:hypothetical protein
MLAGSIPFKCSQRAGVWSPLHRVGFLGGGGHWLVLGWLAGGVFTLGVASVPSVALLVPIG